MMPILTVTNLLTSDIQLQDPSGGTGFSVVIPAGLTKDYTIPMSLAESLEPVLNQSAELSRLTWSIKKNPASILETGTAALQMYTKATLPAATSVASGTKVFVSDEGLNGAEMTSNGTRWLDSTGAPTS